MMAVLPLTYSFSYWLTNGHKLVFLLTVIEASVKSEVKLLHNSDIFLSLIFSFFFLKEKCNDRDMQEHPRGLLMLDRDQLS